MSKNKDSKSKDHKVHSPEVHVAAAGHEDDFVIVPKERSRASYLFMLGLMLFVLLIFTVGGLFTSVVGGSGDGPTDEVVMRWTAPGGTEQEVHFSELRKAMQTADTLASLRFYRPINRDNEARASIEEEDGVLFVILDALSRESGVAISNAEYVKRMQSIGWDADYTKSVASQFRTPTRELERTIRTGLRINKFRGLIEGMVGIAADPEAVEAAWQEANPEFQFQVVEVNSDDLTEQATADVPDDEALAAWYHALPGWKQQKLFTEDKMLPHVAYVETVSDFDSGNLLARYPLPEDWDADAQSQSFYNRYTTTRYKRPEPEEGEEASDDLYLTYEDVKERATKDSEMFYALGKFLNDLKERTSKGLKDEAFSVPEFRQEAESLGLSFDAPEVILTRSEAQERPGWGSIEAVNQFGFVQAESYCFAPIVNEKAMVLGYVHKKQRPEEPEFADIRGDVADMWAEEHAGEIALATLQSVYETLKPEGETEGDTASVVVSAEDFSLSVEAAGLTILERPYLGRGKSINDDQADQTDLGRFLRFKADLYTMEDGMLSVPAMGRTGKSCYLVRLADKRDPELSGLKARDVFQLRQRLVQEQFTEYQKQAFDPQSESFKSTFGLWLLSWDRAAERAAEEDGADAADTEESEESDA